MKLIRSLSKITGINSRFILGPGISKKEIFGTSPIRFRKRRGKRKGWL
jgi:hypothetical protein